MVVRNFRDYKYVKILDNEDGIFVRREFPRDGVWPGVKVRMKNCSFM